MKAVVAAFNQEKALVGAFSVIVQLHRLIDLRHYFLSLQLRIMQLISHEMRKLGDLWPLIICSCGCDGILCTATQILQGLLQASQKVAYSP